MNNKWYVSLSLTAECTGNGNGCTMDDMIMNIFIDSENRADCVSDPVVFNTYSDARLYAFDEFYKNVRLYKVAKVLLNDDTIRESFDHKIVQGGSK